MTLKPCPFCGGKGNIEYAGNPSVHMDFYARCINHKDCGCRFPLVDSAEKAIKAWNTRVTEEIESNQLKRLIVMAIKWVPKKSSRLGRINEYGMGK